MTTEQQRPGAPQQSIARDYGPTRVALLVASVIVILAGVKAAASLLVPFLLAFFIALIAGIPLTWLMRRGISATYAAIISISIIAIALLAISIIIGASISDINQSLPGYSVRLQHLFQQVLMWLEGQGLPTAGQMAADMVNPSAIFSHLGSAFQTLAGILTNGFLIALVVIFMLFEAAHIPDKLSLITNNQEGKQPFTLFIAQMNRYLGFKTLISALTGFLVYLLLLIMGVDFAVLWGFLAFLLNYIPNIGSLIAVIPVLLLVLIDKGFGDTLIVGGGYLLINVLVGNFLETRLMGQELGLSTLMVFASLVFWGWLLGPVGALLSTPLTVVVKIGLETWNKKQWLAILLSNQREVNALLAQQDAEAQATTEAPIKKIEDEGRLD